MISVSVNSANLRRFMDRMEKQIRFATVVALNRTASVVRESLKQEMPQTFDRPTPFTLNSLRIVPATKQKLEATVWFRNPPRLSDSQHYLVPQVFGGERPNKRFERWLQLAGHLPQGWFALPGPGARKDLYGNMSRGQIVQILSALQAMPNPDANRPARYGLTRGSRVRRNRLVFVVIPPGGKVHPGVWQRTGEVFRQVLVFTPRVFYRRRFPIFEISRRVIAQQMRAQFRRALREALATARPNG